MVIYRVPLNFIIFYYVNVKVSQRKGRGIYIIENDNLNCSTLKRVLQEVTKELFQRIWICI